MKKEVLYVDEVKIVGHRHQDGSVEFFGKDAKIMELIKEHEQKDRGAMKEYTEYKIGSAIVRIHGQPDKEKIKEVTEIFLKQIQKRKKECEK